MLDDITKKSYNLHSPKYKPGAYLWQHLPNSQDNLSIDYDAWELSPHKVVVVHEHSDWIA